MIINGLQEFYPTPPTTSLVLTWASILDRPQIPDDMLHKSVTIPYTILYDLFAPLTTSLEPPPGASSGLMFDYNDDVLGIDPSSDLSEPKSEASLPDSRIDADFPDRVVVVPGTDRRTRFGLRNSKITRVE